MTATRRNKITAALSAFFLLISPLLLRAQPESKQSDVIPSIRLDGVPLSDSIKNLARQEGFNYILDPHVPSDAEAPSFTFTLKNATAKEALGKVLKSCALVRIENPVTSVTRIAPEKLNIKPVGAEQMGTDTNAAVPLILFDSVPLKDAIQALAGQMHLKTTFDKKFMATPSGDAISSTEVTVRWKKITAKQALVALLDNYDLAMIPDQSGSGVRITAKKEVVKFP